MHSCVSDIIEFYGSEELKVILVEVFNEWEPIVAAAVKNKILKPLPEECIAKCRQNSKCSDALDKLELKRSIKSIMRKLPKMVIKMWLVGRKKMLMGHFIGSVADLLEFWLHMQYTIQGQVI